VIFSEVWPRPQDAGMVNTISQDLSEFALHARAVLGLPIPQIDFRAPSASHAIVVEGESDQVQFGNLQEVLAEPGTDLRLFGKQSVSGHRRMAVILAKGENVEDARDKAARAAEKLEVKL